jgi:hypothetical protein
MNLFREEHDRQSEVLSAAMHRHCYPYHYYYRLKWGSERSYSRPRGLGATATLCLILKIAGPRSAQIVDVD